MADTPDESHPRENHLLYGHETAEAALHDACKAGRLHHSLLFTGPRGIGMATLAFRLAWFPLKLEEDGLLGLDKPAADDFDVSTDDPVFRQVAAGGHPAIARGRTGTQSGYCVSHAVSLCWRNPQPFRKSFSPGMTTVTGGWRVAIVDPAEAMNLNAANALLKILEEPPERSAIVLVSDMRPGVFSRRSDRVATLFR